MMRERRRSALLQYGAPLMLAGLLSASPGCSHHPTAPARPPTSVHVPDQYPTIQEALDAIPDGDTVWLAPGRYSGPGNAGLKVRGKRFSLIGVAGADSTRIVCSGGHQGLFLEGVRGGGAVINGLTISNAYSSGIDPTGIESWNSNLTLQGCVFTNNSTEAAVIGIFYSNAIMWSCAFDSNNASALDCLQSTVSMDACQFRLNRVPHGDAVVHCDEGSLSMDSCKLDGNSGTGVLTVSGQTEMSRCLVVHNWGGLGGGLTAWHSGGFILRHCTIADNRGDLGGAGIYLETGCILDLTGSIVSGNCSPGNSLGDIYLEDGATATIECSGIDTLQCRIQPGIRLRGQVVGGDPLFCGRTGCGSEPGGDYHLQHNSPCAHDLGSCLGPLGSEGIGCSSEPGPTALARPRKPVSTSP